MATTQNDITSQLDKIKFLFMDSWAKFEPIKDKHFYTVVWFADGTMWTQGKWFAKFTPGNGISIDNGVISLIGSYAPQVSDIIKYSPKNGDIIQYTGADTTDFKNGYFYKYDGSKWVNTKVQPTELTAEQIAALKGEKGDKGDKGDSFKYEDFTSSQLAALKGAKGDTGEKGAKGDKGDPFRYSDFTPSQLAALKGEKGDKGDPFTYSDFTAEQLAALKGEKGDKGDKGDKGEAATLTAGYGISIDGNVISVKEHTPQVSDFANFVAKDGDIVQYVGADNENYKTGHFYKYANLTWSEVDLSGANSNDSRQKVTKFFSANDELEDNEIAEYQGENDVENGLVNGYFYKKKPKFKINYSDYKEKALNQIQWIHANGETLLGYALYDDFRVASETVVEFIALRNNSNTISFYFMLIKSDNIVTEENISSYPRRIINNKEYIVYPYCCCSDNIGSFDIPYSAESNFERVIINYQGTHYVNYYPENDPNAVWLNSERKLVGTQYQVPFLYNGKLYTCVTTSSTLYPQGWWWQFPIDTEGNIYISFNPIERWNTYNRLNKTTISVPTSSNVELNSATFERVDVQPSNGGSPKILSLANITDLTDLILPNQLKENDLIILTDIEENKDYQYTVNGNTKTFRGNPDFDLMFRCATNNEFKPIMFSPIV